MAWTDAEVVTLRDLRGQKASFGKIAKAMGRTRGAVASKWSKVRDGLPAPSFWTAEREQELRDLKAQAVSNDAIAKLFGVSRSTISSRCTRLGIRLSPEAFAEKQRRPRGKKPAPPRDRKGRSFSFRPKPAPKAKVRINPDSPAARIAAALLESARRAEQRCNVMRGGVHAR